MRDRSHIPAASCAALFFLLSGAPARAEGPSLRDAIGSYPYRIVVLSDLHVSEENLKTERKVVSDINAWDDVDLVAVTGDICHRHCTAYPEFSRALSLVKGLMDNNRLVYSVTGNHDYIYKDRPEREEEKEKGTKEERAAKLKRFREALTPRSLFGGKAPDRTYYSQRVGPYLLIFLSVNHQTADYLTQMSDAELKWLDKELSARENKAAPAIVFYHAPLAGTLGDADREKSRFAQPEDKIKAVIRKHKQLFLWVSGHTHTSPDSPYFTSRYKYLGQVTDIHNSDLSDGRPMTNSLYLYPDRVVVRTYDHTAGQFWKKDRTFTLPKDLGK